MKTILVKQCFHVFVKGIDEPIEVSQEGGKALQKILESKDCPPFVRVNGGSYSRFEIARLVPSDGRTFDLEKLLEGKSDEIKNKVREKVKAREKERLETTEGVVLNIISHYETDG